MDVTEEQIQAEDQTRNIITTPGEIRTAATRIQIRLTQRHREQLRHHGIMITIPTIAITADLHGRVISVLTHLIPRQQEVMMRAEVRLRHQAVAVVQVEHVHAEETNKFLINHFSQEA
jgi:hypothetical protein